MAKKCVKVSASKRAAAHIRCYNSTAKAATKSSTSSASSSSSSAGSGDIDGGPDFEKAYQAAVKKGYLPSGMTHRQILEASGYHGDFGKVTKLEASIEMRDKEEGFKVRYETKEMVMQTFHHKDYIYWDLMYPKPGEQLPKGTGLGRKALKNVIDYGEKSGKKRIDIYAAAMINGGPANGFYTWPRYGFDTKHPDHLGYFNDSPSAPPIAKRKKSFHDFMHDKAGRNYWRSEGSWLGSGLYPWGLEMTFDLKKGSKHRKFFDNNP